MAINALGGLSGGLGGAATGASLGSIVPGIGTAIGAGIGGIGGLLAGLFGGGGKGRTRRLPMNPQEQSVIDMLLGQGQQQLQNPYQGFEPIAQQARSQFAQQTVPGLAERFTSLGENRLSSPQFASQLGQAGAGLEQSLAALQSQYGMQQQGNALRQLELGLRPMYDQSRTSPSTGFGGQLFGAGTDLLPLLQQLLSQRNM
jgi:hypothetical protein